MSSTAPPSRGQPERSEDRFGLDPLGSAQRSEARVAASNTLRLSLRGALLGPDIFDLSMWFTPSGTATVPADAATAAALLAEITGASTFTAMVTTLRTFIATTDSYTQYAMYTYPSGGSHSSAAVVQNVALAGTGATRALPNQIATVVSLRSPFAGRNNRGRFYVPTTSQNVISAPTSQLTSGSCSSLATAVANFLSHMNGAAFANLSGQSLRPCVSTRGSSALIASVIVDSVLDTQRRRRNKVTAAASSTQPILIGP